MSASVEDGKPLERREQIRSVAGDLFSAQGYLATSMRELADQVGIEAASIYSHYPSKESLLESLAWELAESFENEVSAAHESVSAPEDQLRAMLCAHIGVIARYQRWAGIFLQEWRHLSQERLAAYLALRDAYERHFRQVIDAGIRSGAFRPTDPKLVSLVLLSAVNMTSQWLDTQGALSVATLSNRLVEILLGGLLQNEPPANSSSPTDQ